MTKSIRSLLPCLKHYVTIASIIRLTRLVKHANQRWRKPYAISMPRGEPKAEPRRGTAHAKLIGMTSTVQCTRRFPLLGRRYKMRPRGVYYGQAGKRRYQVMPYKRREAA